MKPQGWFGPATPSLASVSSDGRFLYAQTGGTGTVDEFRIHSDGSLSPIGSVLVARGQAIGDASATVCATR